MKILITSDNHLGYKETDTLRAEDSFNTFDEILQLGVLNKVDLILQVGDLFHENRPSRYCINRTINILRKHIVDEETQEENNDMPTYKVKIPLLCIHGNHDDPSGFNKISTLDILHSAGLVNYFGKDAEVCDFIQYDKIRIYGVGYVKDKNVTDIFKKIQYKDLSTDYFNILLVHQNRVPRNKDYLCPSAIPESFNLLIYGHEHDPQIIRNNTLLLQCGSTVRTSLSDAECNEKFCYILEPQRNTLSKIRLNSVRPFYMEDTNLVEEKDLINRIENILSNDLCYSDDLKRQKVEEESDKLLNDNSISVINLHNPLRFPPLLPLIRLRILTTNILNLNKNRLSHLFKDKISNPSEIIKLIPHKKVKGKASTIVYQSQNITEIIASHFKCTPLECIPEFKFIEHFNKDSTFVDMVEENMEDISRHIQYDNCMISDLGQEIRKIKMELCRANMNKNEVVEEDDSEVSDDGEVSDDSEVSEEENKRSHMEEVETSFEDTSIKPVVEDIEEKKPAGKVKKQTKTTPVEVKKEKSQKPTVIKIPDEEILDTEKPVFNPITAKDSKTLRKTLNNKPLLNNLGKDDLISDFSKASSPFFTSGFSDMMNTSEIKNNDQEKNEGDVINEKNNDINKKQDKDNDINEKQDKDDVSESFLRLEETTEVRKIYNDDSDSTDLLIDF